MSVDLRPEFWKKYKLDELTTSEWEALCDGCGLCCLVKLEDEDTHEIAYTRVSCKLLDCQTAQCSDYHDRLKYVPDCVQLTPEKLQNIRWLPSSCAYRRVNEGKNLPSWHYLNTGSRKSVMKAKKSAAGRCISETEINEEDIDEYIVRWVR
ncbi:YcgN family cysteine cluster protein [Acinetobacter stercoris]|nr:YcgN family cysteine cluster protein [Acinetobacter stercoris]